MPLPRLIWERGKPRPPVIAEVANALVPSIYPTVRELIQNALDASPEGQVAQVTLALKSQKWKRCPGLDDYQRKLELAFAQAGRDGYMDVGKTHHREVLEELQAALAQCRERDSVPVLTCTDAGTGMAPQTLDRLFRQVGAKGDGAAGAFGQGHLANYRISRLRYILYASRYLDGFGQPASVWSGSALLSGFEDQGRRHTGEAQIALDEPAHANFPSLDGEGTPAFLKKTLPAGRTGTTVAILAASGEEWSGDLLHAVASSFFVPICEERLRVVVEVGGRPRILDGDGEVLREALEKRADSTRVPRDGTQGVAAGAHVWSAYQTYRHGREVRVPLEGGGRVQCWIRPIEDPRDLPTKAVFRNGMWIARDKELPGHLGMLGGRAEKQKFGLVVSFTSAASPRLCALLRLAEPPAHDAFNIRLLRGEEDRRTLRAYCRELAEGIWRRVPSLLGQEGLEPPLFVTSRGGQLPLVGAGGAGGGGGGAGGGSRARSPGFSFRRSKVRRLGGEDGFSHELVCEFSFRRGEPVAWMHADLGQRVGDDSGDWGGIGGCRLSASQGEMAVSDVRDEPGRYRVAFPQGSEGRFQLRARFQSDSDDFSPALHLSFGG